MPQFLSLRALQDNYTYLLHTEGQTLLFDAPEAAPVLRALKEQGWSLDHIFLTHHHDDHTQAVPELRSKTGAKVWGAKADQHRLPPLDHTLTPGETVTVAGEKIDVIDASGHTIGHVAFYLPQSGLAFTGDSLMALGCGRLFEGDAAMMWDTLARLGALPDDTLICGGHDYCGKNGGFALSVDKDNPRLLARLADGGACGPRDLGTEKATNPFLRAPQLAKTGETALDTFTRLRAARDRF